MKTTQDLYDFLNSYQLGAMSTVNADGLPNVALVGFGQTQKLELIFGTDNTSRKYKNLLTDPHIAFTVGGDTPETIQYEGIARELSEPEVDVVRDNYWAKNPRAEKNHDRPTNRYFIVSPTWVRYTNIAAKPWDITELTF